MTEKIHKTKFEEFFDAIDSEMDRHYPEFGDTWTEMNETQLIKAAHSAYLDLLTKWGGNDILGARQQAVDVGAYLAMFYLQAKEEEKK
jgi:hypothetical protein